MAQNDLYKLRYPIGEFTVPSTITAQDIKKGISVLTNFPTEIKERVIHLSSEELNYAYRPEGWTIKQVVHHCADSHMNSLIRFKLALTEDCPTIKPYHEALWAELQDYKTDDLEASLAIITGVHHKLALLLTSFTMEDLGKQFNHPDQNKFIRLDEAILMYAWHSQHHLAHIDQALAAKGKFNTK